MKLSLAHTLRHYDKKNIGKDILAGLIIMAVSIPISMGYALIAGLPAVYGLYGSVFPILAFALLSTSPQFIFGVDAAPAALIGSALLTLQLRQEVKKPWRLYRCLHFCLGVAACIFFYEGGKARQLHIGSGDGRIYHRYLLDDHSYAGAEDSWWYGRNRRVF